MKFAEFGCFKGRSCLVERTLEVFSNQVRQGFKERTLGGVPANQVRQGSREKTLGGCFQAKSDKGSGKGP